MAFWILKTDADTYGFDQLEREGSAVWDGVTNPLALKHLKSMAPGDGVLVYHSNVGKELVGLARITRGAYPDPGRKDSRLVVVDLEPERPLPKRVPLSAIKADPVFANLPLVRMPRLSVIPVPPEQWKKLLAMGGI